MNSVFNMGSPTTGPVWVSIERGERVKLHLYLQALPISLMGFPGGSSSKESACQCRRRSRRGFDPQGGKILWRRKWQPTPLFLSGKSCGQRSLMCFSPWGHKQQDMTEHTHTHNTSPLSHYRLSSGKQA